MELKKYNKHFRTIIACHKMLTYLNSENYHNIVGVTRSLKRLLSHLKLLLTNHGKYLSEFLNSNRGRGNEPIVHNIYRYFYLLSFVGLILVYNRISSFKLPHGQGPRFLNNINFIRRSVTQYVLFMI